ncbi:uncharacterized protein EDB91DRAFT_611786 [Suillus paluster]|uniref:uncharacterized protein n=1 Tax=Suillus paluster TaxID=48578 RepID=UPI001B875DC8|nr:uncharacterized protein EDB91DRAFT_611786 [Suillus paluster]KAG1751534.1 hypothetical protein EDB91DRAFT_611786 [Suillus paluster]
MCLAQRLRHDDDDDAFTSDRHARSGLGRAPSYRKEQRRSDSPAPNNRKESIHNTKSSDRRTSDDKGKEKRSSLPSLNIRGSGSANALHDAQRPASQSVSSAESVDKFLDSINLSVSTSRNPALAKSNVPVTPSQQVLPPTPVSIASVPLPSPGSPAVELRPIPFTFGPERLSLLHCGHSLNYDLNLLPDDPIGPITLLGATQSEPGAYLVAAARYRRTGRSRAACEVIKALLGKHAPVTGGGDLTGENKENAPFHQASLSSAKSPAPSVLTPIDVNTPAHEAAVLRPAFLLLAACQLDISRDCSCPKEKIAHANAAQELFRTVYGTKSDILSSEPGNTNTDTNALGLAFTDRTRIPSTADNNLPTSKSKHPSSIPTAPASTRILALEDELRVTRTAKSTLEADLAAANKRQELTDQSVREAETRSRDALRLLETERDEFRVLRRRLLETEQKISDIEQSAVGAETHVWVRLRDMIYDQFGGARGF